MTTLLQYFKITDPASAEITVKGSKFIALIYPVDSQEKIQSLLKEVKVLHPKARHWCYAWKLGIHEDAFKSSDDGEPSGTAGRPILNQINSAGLTNCVLIVVRYFGGTLLGTSGLIKAYKESSKKCIQSATILKYQPQTRYKLTGELPKMQMIFGILKEFGITIHSANFSDPYYIEFDLPLFEEDVYFKKIKSRLEKTNLNQVVNPTELKDCILTRQEILK